MEKKSKTIVCNLCGHRVANELSAKWKHFFTTHPADAMERIGPMLQNPDKAKEFGEGLGRKLMQEFRQKL